MSKYILSTLFSHTEPNQMEWIHPGPSVSIRVSVSPGAMVTYRFDRGSGCDMPHGSPVGLSIENANAFPCRAEERHLIPVWEELQLITPIGRKTSRRALKMNERGFVIDLLEDTVKEITILFT